MFKRCPKKIKNFTLVELLVVIAIISILAGMLLPALENALNAAQSVRCMNNMKQIGTGFMPYLNDYNDRYTMWHPSPFNNNFKWIPQNQLTNFGDYISDENVWKCDSHYDLCTVSSVNATAAYSHYGFNFRLRDGEPLSNSPISSVSNPSSRVLSSESRYPNTAPTPWSSFYGYYYVLIDSTDSKEQLYGWHNGRLNVLFFDNHVEIINTDEFAAFTWN
ncbi:MAG: prepilin-type N-terminal cleavage/methylation domain-containing protein [Planctomycetota bacterium]|jgi:prepilin-type processing-associated H-X9-DG protein/prepilin-type N-terminal cleavage/methylation domain-containing protein